MNVGSLAALLHCLGRVALETGSTFEDGPYLVLPQALPAVRGAFRAGAQDSSFI